MEKDLLRHSDRAWLDETYDKLIVKMRAECRRVGTDIPYTTGEDGRYFDVAADPHMGLSYWTNGFWPGMLWQMYHVTGEEEFRRAAEGVEERMSVILADFRDIHHDVGFMFLQSVVANYRTTGNEESRRRALHAANLLAGRFNMEGRFIRAWEDLWGR